MNMPDPATGYAFWAAPDGSSKVVYPLSVFQEIDALVNDGYRRIPHGGVETGGLLFGAREDSALRIEAFRPIECQHAYGPSFALSDNDLLSIRQQLSEAAADEELKSFVPLGWFIGHSRSSLELSDREVVWFNEFFPDPGSLTLLVKPERFQPTRFGFLVRDRSGNIERDAAPDAVILPLSGQGSASAARPSIPAPKYDMPEPAPVSVPPDNPPPPAETTRVRLPQPPRQRLTVPAPPVVESGAPVPDNNALPFPYATPLPERVRVERASSAGFGLKSAAILVLAAVLGCIAGYWAYLQLPSPVIPVSVREQQGQLVVEWPSAQTESVAYAALQVDDGQWIALSPEQKTAGHAVVTAPQGDVKIDLLAKHWLRDSRGIVRYIRTPKVPATNQH